MTPEQALELIDANVAQLNGTREAHLQLQMAINVLRAAIQPAAPTVEDDSEALENDNTENETT